MTFVAGTTLTAANLNGGFERELIVFTSSGTFTKASYPWARYARVRVVGGGGGGGGGEAPGAGEISCGGGGGGGGYAESLLTVSALGTSETVTVGSGGSGGAAGVNDGSSGGTSSFGSLVVATGGGGGGGSTADSPNNAFGDSGAQGSGTAGDILLVGMEGDQGVGLVGVGRVMTARGGSTILANPSQITYTSGSVQGPNGNSYGGGAAGAACDQNAAAKAGGDGADGVVIVELFGGSGAS